MMNNDLGRRETQHTQVTAATLQMNNQKEL